MKLFLIVLLALFSLGSLIVFGCDLVPTFAAYLKRIHIGRWADETAWRNAAEKKALQWLKKMPPLPVTDQTCYTVLPRLQGKYYNAHFVCWQQAGLLLGMEHSPEAKQLTRAFFDKSDAANTPYTIGNAMLLFALLKNGFADDPAVRQTAQRYAAEMLSFAGEGTLPYQPNGAHRFVDTLGMACPFLTEYALLTDDAAALELVKRQLDEFEAYGIHPVSGMPVHCFHARHHAPLGLYGWGRGCGWYAIALAECYDLLKGRDAYADVLWQRMERLANDLLPLQNKNGSFNCILGADARADSSATAVLGWFLARAGQAQAAERAKRYLIGVTRRSGEVDFAQGDTMGEGNYSRRFEPLPFAQGFALRIGK